MVRFLIVTSCILLISSKFAKARIGFYIFHDVGKIENNKEKEVEKRKKGML